MEYRIFGPPGTGKTTFLKRQVEKELNNGTSGDTIFIASLTRTAAREIASRIKGLMPEDNVGTLHSLAYQALGRPPLLETANAIADWNQCYPVYALSGAKATIDESFEEYQKETTGDKLFSAYNILRARQTPRHFWPQSVTQFAERWEEWKTANGGIDFTDMLELALRESAKPKKAQVLIIDEAQDLSRLSISLVRSWAGHTSRLFLAGDDDQCLYSWAGSSYDIMLQPPLPEEQKKVLRQSYRVPRAVHRLAKSVTDRIQHREPKEYYPREEEGEVLKINVQWRYPEALLEIIERHLSNGETVAILAFCSMFLEPTIAVLRKYGLPFHNPWRRTRGDWNPLFGHGAMALRNYLLIREDCTDHARPWTYSELYYWAQDLSAKLLPRGAKTEIERLAKLKPHEEVSIDLLLKVFRDDFPAVFSGDEDWLMQSLLATRKNGYEYPVKVFKKRGFRALEQTPLLVVGTIHSVKGGEADNVILYPDLSPSFYVDFNTQERRDDILRIYYVGITRARKRLYLCAPGGKLYCS